MQAPPDFGRQLETYEKLLDMVSNICVSQGKKITRVHLTPPISGKQGGVRTVWQNFGENVIQLQKPLEHFQQFVSTELGTTVSLSAKKELVLYGRFTPANFESLLRSYVKKYCKCAYCGHCDTNVDFSKKIDTITCKYCGKSKTSYAISKTNSKKGKGGKLKFN